MPGEQCAPARRCFERSIQMTCPICQKKSDPKYAPFCSRRCADVDLNRWLKGAYVMPTNEAPKPDEAEPEPEESE